MSPTLVPVNVYSPVFRTLSFAILGMSLSGVFDNTNAGDLLKSLLNILNEHEQTKDTDYKPKMVQSFLSLTT